MVPSNCDSVLAVRARASPGQQAATIANGLPRRSRTTYRCLRPLQAAALRRGADLVKFRKICPPMNGANCTMHGVGTNQCEEDARPCADSNVRVRITCGRWPYVFGYALLSPLRDLIASRIEWAGEASLAVFS